MRQRLQPLCHAMGIGSFAAAKIAVILFLAQGAAAYAADIKVWSGGAFRSVMNELGPQFESATGHKLVVQFGVTPVFQRQLDAGETFDVVILLPPTIEGWIKHGKIVAGTRADIARGGVGVGIRAGAPKPDIGSAEALKRTLLNAKSVSYSAEGASGKHFNSVLDRLGIAADMTGKLWPVAAGGASPDAVAKGEAEIVVALIPSIASTPGVAIAGALPSELQQYIDLSAGVGAAAKDVEAAKALVAFLAAQGATSVIKAKGWERVHQ